jgi:sialate O-acetylesterase
MMRTLGSVGKSLLILVWLSTSAAWAAVKPHPLFTDGAVLQRGIPVPVWGEADEGEQVTVRMQDQEAITVCRGRRWEVRLRPLKTGGPFTLTIEGTNRVEVKDVLVGDVWVASGQSNMEWPLSRTANAQEAIAGAADPMLRLFTVPHAVSDIPLRTVGGRWRECSPETVPGFSAVAYYFGRDLRRALKVPIGLINSSWGGTPAEAWTSRRVLTSHPMLRSILTSYSEAKRNYLTAYRAYQEAMLTNDQRPTTNDQQGGPSVAKPQPPATPRPPYNPENQNRPAGLYNAMIRPLQPYGIRGAIWYQGESNAGRAYQYQTLFPAMIRNWREDWGQGDFPFLFVQLAPFMKISPEPQESAWAELREAQRLTTLTVPHTGMAVITDAGDENDIHPQRKEPVGVRLALAALALEYGQGVEYSGPTYDGHQIKGDRVILSFKHARGGLVAQGGEPKGFTIAGADGKWVNAQATIRGDRVVVSSPEVPRPVAVRYGWANCPVVNLANKAGLPASPFRTDSFPLTTQPR